MKCICFVLQGFAVGKTAKDEKKCKYRSGKIESGTLQNNKGIKGLVCKNRDRVN